MNDEFKQVNSMVDDLHELREDLSEQMTAEQEKFAEAMATFKGLTGNDLTRLVQQKCTI